MHNDFYMNIQKKQSGFTLVEMLVYLAIFMIVSVASVGFMLSLNNFINQYQVETTLYRSGTNIMEQVLLAIRQAEAVDLLNTTEDDPTAGALTLVNAATTTAFTFDGSVLAMSINGVDLGDVTTSSVTVESFTVYHYPLSIGEFVRVRLVLIGTIDGAFSKQITLYGGAKIRGAL
jgi:type II secretory pathway pseudopilin PulG